ncbi:hypothetical protein Lesp02_13040 [Lentzea sp. NBRC 105346]|uniref:LuxR C-terminal-related transcriptional regulator n=1 Tax=Lentzea sp. NBRC 105346 TaxID=3032205 RepID=UPI0024A53F23|nr:LuxR C-terminal-related transcriptional regulator [Lentzea sp. NBRC 105346]GLZ29114.1 hypothetical protein Lesp02_13040 [Lentzea sp. NBRC 105346]
MLLERDAEVTLLTAAARAAAAGSGSVVVITGPLGAGRSALLGAVTGIATELGAETVFVRVSPLEGHVPYGVVRQLTAGGDVSTWGTHRPLVVMIDDLQWADESSVRWLAEIAGELGTRRVLLVVALREGDRRSAGPRIGDLVDQAHVLRPRPLSAAATAVMVRERFREPGHEDFVAACHRTSGGNPLFLTTMLLELFCGGIEPTESNVDVALALRPSSLGDRLLTCLRTQPEGVNDLVRIMAVAGEQVDADLCATLAGLTADEYAAAQQHLAGMDMLADRALPGFVRDLVEESMPIEERERVHVRIAELLHGRGEPAEEVAAHLTVVTSSLQPWAIQVLRQAALVAARRGAHEVAVRYLRRALVDGAVAGVTRARLLVDLATVTRGVDPSASTRHITRAVPLFTSIRDRAEAVVRLGLPMLDSASRTVRELVCAVGEEFGAPERWTGADRDLALRLEARVRFVHAGEEPGLVAAADRLAQLGNRLATAGERELLVMLLHLTVTANLTTAADTAALLRQVLAREDPVPEHVHSTLPLVVTALVNADATAELSDWLATSARSATPEERALIRIEQALVLARTGQRDRAKAFAAEAMNHSVLDWEVQDSLFVPALSWLALETCDRSLRRRLLAHYEKRSATRRWESMLIELLRTAEIVDDGEVAFAVAQALDFGKQLDGAGRRNPSMFPWRMWVVPLQVRLGDVEHAVRLAEEQYELAAAWGAPATLGRALRVLGELTGDAGLLRQAVDVLETSADSAQLAKALQALGYPAEPEAEKPAPPPSTGLSGAEQRVLELAVRGLTNLDIAEELGLSRRTVEKHLTNSYRKLGISGRADLREGHLP